MGSLPVAFLEPRRPAQTQSARVTPPSRYEDGRAASNRKPSTERNRVASSAKESCGAKRANSSSEMASPSSTPTQPLFFAHSISIAVSPTNQTSSPAGMPLGANARCTGSQVGLSVEASPAPTKLPNKPDPP